jgi:hypothetical protein
MDIKSQKNINWKIKLSEEFGWSRDEIDKLLSRIKHIVKSEHQERWEFDAIMQAVTDKNKALKRGSLNDFESGYKIKSVEYRQMSIEMLPRIQEIVQSEVESYPIWGKESNKAFNWNQQIANLICYANRTIDINDLIDFFHEAYIDLKGKMDQGQLEIDKQTPQYFFIVVKNMLSSSIKHEHKYPSQPLDNVDILIDCFAASIESPNQAESFFKDLITVGKLTPRQTLIFDLITDHAKSAASSNKNREFWREVRKIVKEKGVKMEEAAFRKMKQSLLKKIKPSGDYLGFISQSDMDNLRIASNLLKLFEYLEVQS